MEKILVIQLHRLGDVLQSTPALEALRATRPHAHIAVLTRKRFAEPMRGNPHVNELIEWEFEDVIDQLPVGPPPLDRQYPQVAAFARELCARAGHFDRAVNLSNDVLSALFTLFLRPGRVSGLAMLDDGALQLCGDWMHYLFTVSDNRALNSINLCDAMRGLVDAPLQPGRLYLSVSPAAKAFARGFLSDHGVGPAQLLIGVQPGASQAEKRWPAERFGRLADGLAERLGARVLLFGTDGELPLAQRMRLHMRRPPIVAMGRTSLSQLAALLMRCRLLISNDTATVHVAAAVNTPVLALSFGPTYSRETAPYGPGHLILEPKVPCFPCLSTRTCADVRCVEELPVETVLAAAEVALDGHAAPAASLASVGLWRTGFEPDGFLALRPVLPSPLRCETLLRAVYRRFWLSRMLDHREPALDADGLVEELLRSYTLDDAPSLASQLHNESEDFAVLQRLADAGEKALAQLWTCAAMDPSRVLSDSSLRLAQALGRVHHRILESDGVLSVRPLISLFGQRCYENQNLPVVPQIKEQRLVHRDLAAGCRFMRQALVALAERLAPVPYAEAKVS